MLRSLGLLLLAAAAAAADAVPASGAEQADYAGLDRVVLAHRALIGAEAATLAVARDGTLLHSRGFGWMDARRQTPVPPEALMRIASCTKPFTAATARVLAAAGRLDLDQPIIGRLGIAAPAGAVGDPRLSRITAEHLIGHQAGWDRAATSDPTWRQAEIGQALGLGRRATPHEVLSWMLGQPLQFDPGSRRAYSNLGYAMLGQAIVQSAGRSYAEALDAMVLAPAGIADVVLSRSQPRDRPAREVGYPAAGDALVIEDHTAHGGLSASAPALCRFMARHWLYGQPRPPGARQHWIQAGSVPGTTALMIWLRDGRAVAVLYNARRPTYLADDAALRDAVEAALAVR